MPGEYPTTQFERDNWPTMIIADHMIYFDIKLENRRFLESKAIISYWTNQNIFHESLAKVLGLDINSNDDKLEIENVGYATRPSLPESATLTASGPHRVTLSRPFHRDEREPVLSTVAALAPATLVTTEVYFATSKELSKSYYVAQQHTRDFEQGWDAILTWDTIKELFTNDIIREASMEEVTTILRTEASSASGWFRIRPRTSA